MPIVIHVGNDHTAQGIHGIGNEGPVIEAAGHGKKDSFLGIGLNPRAFQFTIDISQINERLIDTIGNEASCNSTGKRHGKPSAKGKFCLGMGPAEANLAQGRKCQDCNEEQRP